MSLVRPHDALFRFVFGEPEQLAELLRGELPSALAVAIDWQGMRRVDASFVDETLQTRQADLLFEARCEGTPLLLHVLVEHKSAADPLTPLQLTRYVVQIRDRWAAEHGRADALPPVLPFLVHHGEQPWSGPRSLRDCIAVACGEAAGPAATALRALQPELPFVLLDLAALDEAEIERRRFSAVADLTVRFLQFLRLQSAEDAAADIARWRLLVASVLEHPRGSDVLVALFSWLVAPTPRRKHTVRTIMTRIQELDPEIGNALRTLMEACERRGLQQGMQQGMQEGVVALRELLVEQLTLRFGALSSDVEQAIATADATALQRWGRRVVTAPTLPDVFASA